MCGIAGILYADADRPVDARVLKAMGDAIAHRGPDAEGFFREAGLGLAHRRLSIIDLAGGDQPMGNEDGSVQVVFNGEIYNFQQLRDELVAKGHTFRTRSDTEVLVHLYEEEGEDLVKRLRGMFAFALWDQRKRRLLLARDRIGIKPLYIYRDAEKLLFGSELKAILAHPNVDRTIDCEAVEDYLAFGIVPGRRAIFRKAEKLQPAHVLSVTAATLEQTPRRYWKYEAGAGEQKTTRQWCEAVESKIAETVKAHQIADVPVGAFLSGGLDSSAIVETASGMNADAIKTFSIGFREERFSELPFARQVAEQFGCEHTERIVTPEAIESLDDLVHFYDEPFADSSAIPTMQVSRLAREKVKVVLSGDGGDEAFGGYSRYVHDLHEARWRERLPRWARQGVLGPLARVWPKADWLPRVLRAKTLLTNLSLPANRAYANTLSLNRLPIRRQLLSADVLAGLNGHRPEQLVADYYGQAPANDPLAAMIAADVGMLLPDDFLTKVDRASMSCGLEVRPPLVDHELLELSAQIPSELKIRGGQSKWILNEIYRERLPLDVTSRAKQGFEIPIDEWLRGPLRDVFESTVLNPNSRVGELLDQRTVRKLYRAHQAKIGRHGNALWSILVLARWAEKYLSPSNTTPDATTAASLSA
jgi:asparagine synthase (glutamine-hydrolysing)